MTIRYTCTQCGSHLKIKDEKAGKPGHCPQCKAEFIIPAPEAAAVGQTTAAATADAPPTTTGREPPPSTEELAGTLSATDTVTIDPAPPAAPPDSDTDLSSPPSEPAPAADPVAADADEEPMLTLTPDDGDLDEAPVLVQAAPEPKSDARPAGKKKTTAKPFDPADFLMGNDSGDEPPKTARRPDSQRPNFDLLAAHAEQRQRSHSDLDAPTPTPDTKSTGTAAAATEAWNHAKAAKQMMKAIKQSNAEAAQARDEGQEERFDYIGAFRELGLKGVGGLAAILVGAMFLYYLSNSVMGGGPSLPPLGYVTGTVTLDGQPLAGAIVTFEPVEKEFPGHPNERLRSSVGTTDAGGKYRLYYLPDTEGVAVGKCLVYLSRIGDTGREMIPGDYVFGSMQTRDVSAGKQTFDFPLTSPQK